MCLVSGGLSDRQTTRGKKQDALRGYRTSGKALVINTLRHRNVIAVRAKPYSSTFRGAYNCFHTAGKALVSHISLCAFVFSDAIAPTERINFDLWP